MTQSFPNDGDDSPVAAQLLERARCGDRDARNELFEKCRPYVTLVARAQIESWLQAKVDHSDLVQQTLLEAHRGLNNFRGTTDGEWLAWLKRIVQNNAADFVRHYGMADKRPGGPRDFARRAGRQRLRGAGPRPQRSGPNAQPNRPPPRGRVENLRKPSRACRRTIKRSSSCATWSVCRSTKSPNGWAARVRPFRCSGCGRSANFRKSSTRDEQWTATTNSLSLTAVKDCSPTFQANRSCPSEQSPTSMWPIRPS